MKLSGRILLLALLGYVVATKEDISWRAVVDITKTSFAEDGLLYVNTAVVLTRIESTANVLTLAAHSVPVGNREESDDGGPAPQLVFLETIQVAPGQNTFTWPMYLNYTLEPKWQNQSLSLSVVPQGGLEGNEAAETNGAILIYSPLTDSFEAKSPGQWAHDENERLIKELEAEEVETHEQDPDGDLGEEPDRPGSPDDRVPDKPFPPKDETGHDGPIIIIVNKTTTVCPTPTPPPPPCPDEPKALRARQFFPSFVPAYVNAHITFVGWSNRVQNLRLVQVTAYGDVFDSSNVFVKRVRAFKTLDVRGEARFRFNLEAGQRIHVNKLITRLEGNKYVIGTRPNAAVPLTRSTISMILTKNPWNIRAGETKSYTNNHPRNTAFDGIIVADAFQRISDYARVNVAASYLIEKIPVWFPSSDSDTYFSEAGPFINIPPDDGRDPDVLAHEYGHYLHYLARDKAFLNAGGKHKNCKSPNNRTALSEGYATAFGLMAVDQTILASSVYGQYVDAYPRPATDLVVNYETYGATCNKRTLNNVEGRITASIWDLGDRLVDTPNAASDDFARIGPGFRRSSMNIRFYPNFLFWRAVRTNPKDMKEYWYRLQSLITTEEADRAWSILCYNWADFPRTNGGSDFCSD
jgi:hypothetical protein